MSDASLMTFLGLAGLLGLALHEKIKADKKMKKQPIPVKIDKDKRRKN